MNFSEIKYVSLVLDMQTAIIRHLPVYNEPSGNVAKAVSRYQLAPGTRYCREMFQFLNFVL